MKFNICHKIALLYVLFQLSTIINCYSQYYFKHYQVDDGLIHNSVTSVIQDSKGFMWIGTRGGLNRFDGYAFKSFKNNQDPFGSLGNNVINCIVEDKNGVIWIGTGQGLFQYNPLKETLSQLDFVPKEYISNIVVDNHNNLWLLIKNHLYYYLNTEKKLINQNQNASCIAIDSNMSLWLGDNDGNIFTFDYKNKIGNIKRILSKTLPYNARSISKIFPVGNHKILIGCFRQGLKYFDTESGKVENIPLGNDKNKDVYVRDINTDKENRIWTATESGIYINDIQKKTSINLTKINSDYYSLSDNAVYSLCRDNQGGMWAGTFFGGINYYSPYNARFEKYYPIENKNSIAGYAIREICTANTGNLWIGTEDGGISYFNLKNKIFKNYTSNIKNGGLSYPNIHGLLEWKNELLVGPFMHGLEIMDIRSGKIKKRFNLIGDKSGQFKSDFVISIFKSKDNKIFIGTAYHNGGLFEYNYKKQNFIRIKEIPVNTYVYDIFEDHKGNIWTGSVREGAYYYNPYSGKHGNIRFGNTSSLKKINEFPVYNIFEDSDKSLWFATTGGGLIRLSSDWKKIKRFTTYNGLPSNVVYSILEDSSKNLWVSSLKGLISLDIQSEKIKV